MNERLDITSYPELAQSLQVDRLGTHAAETLCTLAESMLDQQAELTRVNGVPAEVTPLAHEMSYGDKPLYARLARLSVVDADDRLPLIVFDDTPNVDVSTPNAFALRFKSFGGEVSLVAQNDLDTPAINDPRYLELAKQIILSIGKQLDASVAEIQAAKAARKRVFKTAFSKAKEYFADTAYAKTLWDLQETTVGKQRRNIAATVTGMLLAGYGHLLYSNVDAAIGPVPMPQPIEFLVDVNNMPDHRAQGFDEPDGAVTIEIGGEVSDIPLLSDYDTSGVPDATYTSQNSYITREESRPGLYEVDYALNQPEEDSDEDADESEENAKPEQFAGCLTISGSFIDGQSRVFTQDNTTRDNIRLITVDADQLELCPAEGANEPLEGSVFVYQRH